MGEPFFHWKKRRQQVMIYDPKLIQYITIYTAALSRFNKKEKHYLQWD